MNGPLAQIVALTCYGNASIGGIEVPQFLRQNSTCQFCNSVIFIEFKKTFFGKPKENVVSPTPDEWLAGLVKRGATSIRLVRGAQNAPAISGRMSAGFVGGGGTWMMEVLNTSGESEFWAARWEVGVQNAPERRIWNVTYALVGIASTRPDSRRAISVVKAELEKCLTSIHLFAARENCGGFIKCFADALKALEAASSDVGYHRDLAVPHQLNDDQESMLKASMCAWVFGGMGSWNDIGFDGPTQLEYEVLSDELFKLLNEAIEVTACSTATGPAPTE